MHSTFYLVMNVTKNVTLIRDRRERELRSRALSREPTRGTFPREPGTKFSKKSGTGGNRESKILNNREPGSRERAGTRHRFSSISAQFFTGSKVGSPRIFIFFSFE